MQLLTEIETLLKPPLATINATISAVTLKLEHGTHVLHVALSRSDGPVDLDFIVKATELISPLLDMNDIIKHHYVLDVSSAGIEKDISIEQLNEYIGSYIAVHLRKPWRTENVLQANLLAFSPTTITLSGLIKGKKYTTEISIADIDNIREAIKF